MGRGQKVYFANKHYAQIPETEFYQYLINGQ
jgi:hypothetical protein